MVAKGEIETVVVGFTDHYGRLLGKRFDAEMFVEDIVEGGGSRLRLPAHRRHGDGAGARATPSPTGSSATAISTSFPTSATLRIASWLDKTAFVLCDVKNEKTHEYVAGRAALDPAPPARSREDRWATTASPHPSSSITSSGRAIAKRTQQDYRDLEPGGLVPRGLPHPPGHAHRGLPRRRAPPPEELRRAGRELQRRMGHRASTKSTCATPKRSTWPTATSCSSSA